MEIIGKIPQSMGSDAAMSEVQTWTEADFGAMSRRDVHVHGLAIRGSEADSGELILDIDDILEWLCKGDGANFRVAQAALRFHDVADLRMGLACNYPGGLSLQAFSLSGVERDEVGDGSATWRLTLNWPEGEITFKARGFTQTLVGPAHIQEQQSLAAALRIDWTRTGRE